MSTLKLVVGDHFKLVRKLGSGAFGDIFKAKHKKTKETVAVKLEQANTSLPQLYFEAKIYKYMHKDEN